MHASSAEEGIGQSGEKLRPLVLASASPRRHELLGQLGIAFHLAPANIDEAPRPGEPPLAYSARIASAKAEACASRYPGATVLAADTVVTLDGAILGKPADADEARATLARLAGQTHFVITSFCIRSARTLHRSVVTEVDVVPLSDREIDAYIDSGEWRDKAGGYAIQGRFAYAVSAIRGSYTNVVGLPLAEVVADLMQLGVLESFPPNGFAK